MRFKKVKVNQTKLCWNEQDLYFHQKTIREYSVKHDSFFHTCLTFCKYVWEKPNLCVKYHTCSFWQMFDFYPTCLEKTKHVGIFTPGCYFPHMFGFWHIGMGKGTHVCKKPHNYMFANVWHFPHMCGKSHWHAYFPLSYGCSGIEPITLVQWATHSRKSSLEVWWNSRPDMKRYLWDWGWSKRIKTWVTQLSERYHVNCFLTSSHMIVPGHMTVKAIVMLLVKTTYTAFNSPMFLFPFIWKFQNSNG